MAIVVERLWMYRPRRVLPANLVAQIWQLHQKNQLTSAHVTTVRNSSPLGRILAAGLVNRLHAREVMKEAIEEEGRQVVEMMAARQCHAARSHLYAGKSDLGRSMGV